jgi:hypothetical protein
LNIPPSILHEFLPDDEQGICLRIFNIHSIKSYMQQNDGDFVKWCLFA